ncbi:hypothetical protein ACFSUK_08345 [Sphingobium scionense]
MKMPHAASLLAIAWLAGTAPVAVAQTAPVADVPRTADRRRPEAQGAV